MNNNRKILVGAIALALSISSLVPTSKSFAEENSHLNNSAQDIRTNAENQDLESRKTTSIQKINANDKLSNEEKLKFTDFVSKSSSIGQINDIETTINQLLDQRLSEEGKNKAKILDDYKRNSIEYLNNNFKFLNEKDKQSLLEAINKSDDENEINILLEDARKQNKESAQEKIKKEIEKVDKVETEKAKKDAIKELEALNLPKHILKMRTDHVNEAKSMDEIKEILNNAKEGDQLAKITKAKKDAIKDLDSYTGFTNEQRQNIENSINAANTIEEVKLIRSRLKITHDYLKPENLKKAKTNALRKIKALSNLTEQEKESFKNDLSLANELDQIKKIQEDAIKKASKPSPEALDLAKYKDELAKKIEDLDRLSDTEKNDFLGKIYSADNKNQANEFVEKAKQKNSELLADATKDLPAIQNKAKKEIDKLKKLSGASKKLAKKDIEIAKDEATIEDIVQRARIMDSKLDTKVPNNALTTEDLPIGIVPEAKMPNNAPIVKDKIGSIEKINDKINDQKTPKLEDKIGLVPENIVPDKAPIVEDKDGALSPKENNKSEKKADKSHAPEKPSEDKKENKIEEEQPKTQNKKNTKNNVKTGVAGISGVVATLAAATSAYFVTKKKMTNIKY